MVYVQVTQRIHLEYTQRTGGEKYPKLECKPIASRDIRHRAEDAEQKVLQLDEQARLQNTEVESLKVVPPHHICHSYILMPTRHRRYCVSSMRLAVRNL